MPRRALPVLVLVLTACGSAPATLPQAAPPAYPVTPELVTDRFDASEGLTFNGEGELFVGANRAVWRLEPDGSATRLAEVDVHLGQAGIGERDVLAADFGPTNPLRDGADAPADGVVWRVTPEGEKTVAARGIGDPNAIQVMPDGSFLVSDDFTDRIYRVSGAHSGEGPDEGEVSVWSTGVPFPNGLALSLDRRTLYVAQIFSAIRPEVVLTGAIWAIPVGEDGEAGPAERILLLEDGKGFDGIVLDAEGRLYIADNGNGRVLRFDPETGEVVTIAEGMTAIASLVFGEGDFDPLSLYGTSTFRGGGNLWRIPVGVRGATPIR